MRNRGWHKTLFSGLTDFSTLEKELGESCHWRRLGSLSSFKCQFHNVQSWVLWDNFERRIVCF